MLENEGYIYTLEKKYPELFRLIKLRVNQTVIQIYEITSAVNQDYEELLCLFCRNKRFIKISDIQLGLSDPHNGGKTVARVVFDNGVTVIYKPRGLKQKSNIRRFLMTFAKDAE